jgi:uncharacterized protein (TIGR02246 family)
MKITKVLLACCFALMPCLASAQDLSREDVGRITEVTQSFEQAIRTRNFKAVAALYTEDGVLYSPGETAVKGRTSIETCLAALPTLTDFKLRNTNVEGNNDIAYVQGTFFMTAMDGSEEVEDSGYYLEVRRKQADGKWLIAVHMLVRHE